jgi:penicillin-binding protein 1C
VALEWVPAHAVLADCGAHRLVAVDRRSGRLATAATPAREIEARTFVELPARYAGWLARQGAESLPEALAGARGGSQLAGETETVVRILSPEQDARLYFDPETPRELATLALRATVEPPVEQLVWYVDGRPVATVDRPYSTRWRLEPGVHVVQARVPFSAVRSRTVRFLVE